MVPPRQHALLGHIINAISQSGWCVFHVDQAEENFLQLQVYRHHESLQLRVCASTLMCRHRGRRSGNEYSMDIEDFERRGMLAATDSMLVGWWDKARVFAGFDTRQHLGTPEKPIFVHVAEAALREAYLYGFSPWLSGKRELVLAFRPEFFITYAQNAGPLHDFWRSRDATATLRRVFLEQDVMQGEAKPLSKKHGLVVARIVDARKHQDFQGRVLTSYNNRCAFCGCRFNPLQAVHIIPTSDQSSTNETRNGLALCTLHYRAFEQGIITVDDKYSVLVNEAQVDEIKALKLAEGIDRFKRDLLPMILLPPAISDRPHIEYIKAANRIRGWSD